MPLTTPQRLEFDAVTIDFAARRVLLDGREQALEPKAFGVLALLVQTPGRVFEHDEILDAVWGHRHVTPGVLHRVMTLLRHALGEDAHHPRYLHTVHGVGYRFELPAAGSATPQAAPTQAGEILETSGVPGPPGSGRRRRVTDREAAPGWWATYRRWLVTALLVVIAFVAIIAVLQERPRRTPTAATPATAVRP